MDGRENWLYVGGVLHKAFVEASEEGTEAAAVMGVIGQFFGIEKPSQPVPIFRADHPFIALIFEKGTRSILFLGRLVNAAA